MSQARSTLQAKITVFWIQNLKSWSSSMTTWQFHKTSCRWLSGAHYGRFTKKTISLSVLYPAKVNFIGGSLLAIQIQQFLNSLRNCHVRLEASEIHILCTLCLLEERRLAISYGFGKKRTPIFMTSYTNNIYGSYLYMNWLPSLILTWNQKIWTISPKLESSPRNVRSVWCMKLRNTTVPKIMIFKKIYINSI